MCDCCIDENPGNFTLIQGTTFGPTDDSLAPSIYYKQQLNDLPIDITGYVSTLVAIPKFGTGLGFTLSSANPSPASRLIQNNADGSIAPYFASGDVTYAPGIYSFYIQMAKGSEVVPVFSGEISVEVKPS